MRYEFTIPIKVDARLSLNKIYSGVHYAVRRKMADEIHAATRYAILESGSYRLTKDPVAVSMWFCSGLDLDNHGFLAKCIIDGMKGLLIADDNKKYLKSLTFGFWGGDGVLVQIQNV